MGSLRLDRRAGLVLIALTVSAALLLAVFPVPAAASATILHITSGSATVVRGGVPHAATHGELLREGDAVTTLADGNAVMAFADGSTMTIEPSTTVSIVEASTGPTSTVTRLVQSVGRTWSSVQRLTSTHSRYEIRTPALTATVRGTAFEVEVSADGTTRVRTLEGVVAVANERGEVLVVAGTQTTAVPGTPPAPPAPPPPEPQRSLQIGSAQIVVIDDAGRGCGRVEGAVLQQIPGCLVQGDEIRIVGAAADERLVAVSTTSTSSVVERVTVPGTTSAPVVRQVEVLSAAVAPPLVVVTPRPTPLPTEEVNVPILGAIPVQPLLATAVPTAEGSSTPAPIIAPLVTVTLQPLPTLAPAPAPTVAPLAAPSVAVPTTSPLPALPAPLPTPTIAVPTPTIAPPTATVVVPAPTVAVPTIEPSPIPTLAVPTIIPTAVPTAPPTVIPTVAPSAAIVTPTPAPSPAPVPTATPAPSPTPEPTPAPVPTLPLPLASPALGLP